MIELSAPDDSPQLFGDILLIKWCEVEGRHFPLFDNRKGSGFLEAIHQIRMLPRIRRVQRIYLLFYPMMRLFLKLLVCDRRPHFCDYLMQHFPYRCFAKLIVIDVPNWLWTYI